MLNFGFRMAKAGFFLLQAGPYLLFFLIGLATPQLGEIINIVTYLPTKESIVRKFLINSNFGKRK